MIGTAFVLTMIVLLLLLPPGGWSSAFMCMSMASLLLSIPMGLQALLGDVGGWIGVGILGLIAAGAVAQSVARLIEWWRGDEPALAEDDHF